MKNLSPLKMVVLGVADLLILTGFFTFWIITHQTPAQEPVSIGFTWISPGVDQDGNPFGVVLEDTKLRITYTTGMTVVQNKDKPDDPYMFSGGTWYFRTTPGQQLFEVAVVSGKTLVAKFDDVMVVSNNQNNCDGKTQPCTAGSVYLLTAELKPIYVETSAHQYVVINP